MSSPPKDKPRLTEQEKKNNHIASEQKRRQAIRDGFDRLANLVPGMSGMGRSEHPVLQGTVDEITKQIAEYNENMAQLRQRGLEHKDLEIQDMNPPASNGVGKGA